MARSMGNLTRRSRTVVLFGGSAGLAAMVGGFARYFADAMTPTLQRVAVCTAIFVGALLLAASLVAFCKLRGTLEAHASARPGDSLVDFAALALCVWLGYGFATAPAQMPALAALLAMGALAAALGAHRVVLAGALTTHAHLRCPSSGQRVQSRLRFEWRDVDAHACAGDGCMQPWKLEATINGAIRRNTHRSVTKRRDRQQQRYRAMRR
ncbi:NAD(P)(+) transhydrogenase (Re/Si-specific) subunit beta [Paraburkholderia megapolitana]|uniref:NAD(P)(+) transhydrogenase (Re/Si-specific) subunit beta n=1 Tax=Paraburkholderia megapolitana TaxID=420953 RepID=UPI0038BDDA93